MNQVNPFHPEFDHAEYEVEIVAKWLRGGELRRLKFIRSGVGEVTWDRAINEVTNVRFADDGHGNRVYEDGRWVKL